MKVNVIPHDPNDRVHAALDYYSKHGHRAPEPNDVHLTRIGPQARVRHAELLARCKICNPVKK